MTKVKICGLTKVEDAQAAVQLGAWALGMVFWPGSPRVCEVDEATAIAREFERQAETVGVFCDSPLDDVMRMADMVGFSTVQLHGDEGPAYCDKVARRTGCKIIKAVRVRDQGSVRQVREFRSADFHLMDSYREGVPGGTGEQFDWRLAQGSESSVPLILSGGLSADNVAEAVARVNPFAVDVASGTEVKPGVKSPERTVAFFRAVEQADILAAPRELDPVAATVASQDQPAETVEP